MLNVSVDRTAVALCRIHWYLLPEMIIEQPDNRVEAGRAIAWRHLQPAGAFPTPRIRYLHKHSPAAAHLAEQPLDCSFLAFLMTWSAVRILRIPSSHCI